MNDTNSETRERRNKCLAYGLLVVAAITFTHEVGRQRGVAEAGYDEQDRAERRMVASAPLASEPAPPRREQHADARGWPP